VYEDYFGLERPPFKITPDTSLFYEGGKRGDILAALVYAVQRGEGIVKVVGEVGSGKTMLCRMLQLELPPSVEIVYIANPSVSPEDILFVIAHELSLQVTRDSSKHEVMHLLQDYLLQRHVENKQVVLFIEEAQGMPLETLEEIRLLSNLETDQHKLLQIILFGQPELDVNLAQQSIRQLRERITHNFRLEPLTLDEIHNYLNFRMREVGYTGPELINRAVAKKVEQYSGGLLRRINILADKILLSAFAEGTHDLNPKHVTSAVNDSSFEQETRRRTGRLWWLVLVVILALAFALYQTRSQWFSPQALGGTQGQALTNDKPVTDITSQAGQTSKNAATVPAASGGNGAVRSVPQAVASAGGAGTQATEPARDTAPPGLSDKGLEQSPGEVAQAPADARQATDMNENMVKTGSTTAVTRVQSDISSGGRQASGEVPQRSAAEKAESVSPAPVAQPVAASAEQDGAAATRASLDMQSRQGMSGSSPVSSGLTDDHNRWLNAKLKESKDWLSQADSKKVSIQVLMRRKSAARELVYYLRNEWPLDLSKTYLYEVNIENRLIYRVFYSEYDSLAHGRQQLDKLPETVKVNSPYLHSVHRMQKALL
jgi:type II secretory pathway predicted ATPase ExeA/Tfp pilus assembly protein PilV